MVSLVLGGGTSTLESLTSGVNTPLEVIVYVEGGCEWGHF
jgi:hypothetical protein